MSHNNIQRVRYLTENYGRLQGLRAVPIGLFVLFAAVWSNFWSGELGLSFVILVLATVGYIIIDRYYAAGFGKVTPTRSQRIREAAIGILFMVLGLVSFALDSAKILPIDSLGLVFAAGILADFSQVMSPSNELRKHPEAIASAAVIAVISLLPLTGWAWWKGLGMHASINGVLLIAGLMLIATGLVSHFRLRNVLQTLETKQNEQSV